MTWHRRIATRVIISVVACLLPNLSWADRVPVGVQVAGLAFKDTRFLRRELRDLGQPRAIAFVAINGECPLVQRYIPKLKRIDATFRPHGVQVVGLFVDATASIREMATFATDHDIGFPVVQDIDGICAKRLGLLRTPEVALLDADHTLRYRGRIDNQYRLGGALPKANQDNLIEAISALLDDREIDVRETEVDGCVITQVDLAESRGTVTYADDVAPIVRAHCIECHQPGTEAPLSLCNYGEVAGQGKMLAEVVRDERMPPWYGSTHDTGFQNHRRLSDDERETIEAWVAQGMPRGDQLSGAPAEPVYARFGSRREGQC